MKDGFIKVAAAAPEIKVADTEYNAEKVIEAIKDADSKGVKILAFPELTLTGCTCYDLISHKVLLDGAKLALEKVIDATDGIDMLVFVGIPFAVGTRIYNCAAAVYCGDLLGLVPKEFVKDSHFSAPSSSEAIEVNVGKYCAFLSSKSLFEFAPMAGVSVAAVIGSDIDAVDSPAVHHAQAGASIIVSLAGFPETTGSTDDALLTVRYLSKHLKCAVIMAAPGKGESTTDNVFSGLCLVSENGTILSSDEALNDKRHSIALSEIDCDYLMNMRRAGDEFDCNNDEYYSVAWGVELSETKLTRSYSRLPVLPDAPEEIPAYCERTMDIQVSGLVKRMEYAHVDHCVIGISGGVDSTLAVMISAMAMKRMGLPSTNVVACTMPCFGTSSRTKSNAIIVAEQIGAEVRVIDIGEAVYKHFDDIGHAHDDYSIAFENAQARERTQVLFDVANKVNGINVGTEDLSEFVDGWCTFNGDHTSNYDVNMGLTKTQVRANVRYIAQTTQDKTLSAALWDVLDCPVTPELLPIHDDQIEQKSEDSVGSYSLQDFLTHKIMICGFTPAKAFRLAKEAYGDEFSDEELIRWIKSYCKRYFSQQFKRSCLMDGPAVDAFTVSPRVGFLIPSDGEATLFLNSVESLEK